MRGDVWWCEHPDIPRRPCVVLSRDEVIPVLRRALVAFATTTVRGLPTEVALEPDEDDVPRPCVLNLDTPEMVSTAFLTVRLGRLRPAKMREICAALEVALDCD